MEEKGHLLPMNLQFFASKGDGDGGEPEGGIDNAPSGTSEPDKNKPDEAKPMTQAQIDEIVESRLGRERASWEKTATKELTSKIKDQLAAEQSQAKKLEDMSEVERANFERDEANKKAQEYEAKIARIDTESQVTKMLAEKEIIANEDVLNMLVRDGMDAEQIKTSVDSFSELVNDLADAKVKQKMAGKIPNKFGASGVSSGSGSMGETFAQKANESDKASKNGLWN